MRCRPGRGAARSGAPQTRDLRLTRRALLAGTAGFALPAGARGLRRVLFVGNSFLRQHDVPGQVTALSIAAGREIAPHVIVRNGARLALHVTHGIVTETLSWGWEAVVLQDHSTEALDPLRAGQSASAVRRFRSLLGPTPIVLVVPWSRAPGHPLYARPGMPAGPEAMTRANLAHWRAIAEETGSRLANVAGAFALETGAGRRVHAPDGYHASPEGARVAAATIWGALAGVLA